MKTDMYAGVGAVARCCGVSPSHDWSEKTKETLERFRSCPAHATPGTYHPIILYKQTGW